VPIPQIKKCAACQEDKPASEFGHRKGKEALNARCKPCASRIAKEWREANRDRYNKFFRDRNKDPEKRAESVEYINDWRKRNPAKVQAMWTRRKALKRHAPVNDLTADQIQQRFDEFNWHCAYCLKPFEDLEVEHTQPLSKGGSNTLSNIIPACRSCNARKGAKTLLEFLALLTQDKLADAA
jgi:5-methylcytosine-specific restriction endonuclease McrA